MCHVGQRPSHSVSIIRPLKEPLQTFESKLHQRARAAHCSIWNFFFVASAFRPVWPGRCDLSFICIPQSTRALDQGGVEPRQAVSPKALRPWTIPLRYSVGSPHCSIWNKSLAYAEARNPDLAYGTLAHYFRFSLRNMAQYSRFIKRDTWRRIIGSSAAYSVVNKVTNNSLDQGTQVLKFAVDFHRCV